MGKNLSNKPEFSKKPKTKLDSLQDELNKDPNFKKRVVDFLAVFVEDIPIKVKAYETFKKKGKAITIIDIKKLIVLLNGKKETQALMKEHKIGVDEAISRLIMQRVNIWFPTLIKEYKKFVGTVIRTKMTHVKGFDTHVQRLKTLRNDYIKLQQIFN